MEMIVIDTLGAMQRHGYGLFGWCSDCGSPSRYWEDVRARRTPKPAMFDIDLSALVAERGERCAVGDAAIVAAQRADECLAAGDVEGQSIWKHIVDAILELLKDTPDEGERVN